MRMAAPALAGLSWAEDDVIAADDHTLPVHPLGPLASVLMDPRDTVIVGRAAILSAIVFAGAATLYVIQPFNWYLAIAYLGVVLGLCLARYILMLHCVSHRRLFKRRYGVLNLYIPCVLGPFFGQSPFSYFAHHVGMHHRENNAAGDLSSTERYQRASAAGWLAYVGRFLIETPVTLPLYFLRRRRRRMFVLVVAGESTYWIAIAGLMWWVSVPATLIVFVVPLIFARIAMMAGNWGQHAFIDPDNPDDPYRNTITCINTPYNRRCYNDGYHIVHHLQPGLHYTEMAAEFDANIATYGANDAVVFDGLDFFQVWWLLMTRRWRRLARAFVALPGAPQRSEAEIVELLRARTAHFHRPAPE